MMYPSKLPLFVTLSSILLMCFSCNGFLSIDPPKDQLVSSKVFTDEQSAKAALFGIYGDGLSQDPLGGGLYIASALTAGEIENHSSNENYDQFQNHDILPDNVQVNVIWNKIYSIIYQANLIIEGMQHSTELPDEVKAQIKGEALFVRAYCYFWLTNIWGSIPIVLTSAYDKNQSLPNDNGTAVYARIVEDLTKAYALIDNAYQGDERVRPNKATVAAMLARVYLYLQQWNLAVQYATKVIDDPRYQLSNVNDVFVKESGETIWQVMSVGRSNNTAIAPQLVPPSTSSVPSISITNDLIQIFETGDKRLSSWIGKNVTSTEPPETYSYPYKYKVANAATKQEYQVIFRLAEQYLIRAEALAQLGNLADAAKDINVIRQRAEVDGVHFQNREDLFLLLMEERQRELFLEGGHRWFDLKRTGQIDVVMGQKYPHWKSYKALWPIPYNQLLANPFLIQNAGY